MATARRSRKSTAARKRPAPRKKQAEVSLDRLNKSLDVAQKTVNDLRKDLSRGGRDLLKDVQKLISDARRDTRRLNRSLLADLGQLGQTLTGGGTRGKRATAKPGRKRAASGRATKARAATRTRSKSKSGGSRKTTKARKKS